MRKSATIFFTFRFLPFTFHFSPFNSHFSLFNSLKAALLALLLLFVSFPAFAGSRITKNYNQRPLPEVLRDIDNAAPEIDIRFIYNKLEDYTVTCSLKGAAPMEAIQQAIGFYPVRVKQDGGTVIVEPVFDTEQKLVGRIVDDKGAPLEFANVKLYSPADNSFITGGVTNRNGDFVIPCSQRRFVVNVSYVGYETLVRSVEMPASGAVRNVGTWAMKVGRKSLGTVVVKGDIATTSAEKSTYIPTKRQRNAATDATALLQHMMIPQLRLNPLTGYVTTLAGENVSIFIDYIPATKEDLEGMNTQDVKRVELYDFPTDARFQGKEHVVNFVMQKYEVGGYTKLTTTNLFVGKQDLQTSSSVYSKLAYKRMTFDANLSESYADFNHVGSQTSETFRLPKQDIVRTSLSENGAFRTHRPSASLRATYSSEKIQISNRLEFLYEDNPKDRFCGTVSYSPEVFRPSASESDRSKSSISSTYEGNWRFSFPNDWKLAIAPSYWFSHNKVNRYYREGDIKPIENDIREDASQFSWAAEMSKTFAGKHTISAAHYGERYQSLMDYAGFTTSNSKMTMFSVSQNVRYTFSTKKLNLSATLLYGYTCNGMDSYSKERWFPNTYVYASYSPNSKHNFKARYMLGLQGGFGADLNSNVLSENSLMYYCGNPAIDDYHISYALLQYTWMPSNKFTASAFAQNYFYSNFFSNVYKSYMGGKALIRRLENVGDMSKSTFGASLTLRLLEGSLQLNASPECCVYDVRRENDQNRVCFNITSWAAWYFGNYYLQAYYASAASSYQDKRNAWDRQRSQFQITAGWGNATWKARFVLTNPFRTDWRDNTTEITSPLYIQKSHAFNAHSHQHLNFTLTYIFNYGKKVKQGNELGTASGGQSSIL